MSEKTSPHADPSDASIAAILAFDLDQHHGHEAIAAALKPHVLDAPPLREWSEDDEWTAAEEAVAAASDFRRRRREPGGGRSLAEEPGSRSVRSAAPDAGRPPPELGSGAPGRVPGLPGQGRRLVAARRGIRVWEAGVSTSQVPAILALDTDTTRREVQIAISAWKAWHDAGSAYGAARIRTASGNCSRSRPPEANDPGPRAPALLRTALGQAVPTRAAPPR